VIAALEPRGGTASLTAYLKNFGRSERKLKKQHTVLPLLFAIVKVERLPK
jgi:hypothetical protein